MSSAVVLAPFPVLSQAFSALSTPTPASLSHAAANPLSPSSAARRGPSSADKRVVKLQLPSAVDDGRPQLKQDLQLLRRSLTVLLTPPQAFVPPASSSSSSSPASSGALQPHQPALPASLQQLYAIVRQLANGSFAEDVWDAARLAVERGAGSVGGAMRASAMGQAQQDGWQDGSLGWLVAVKQGWTWWKAVTSTLRSILLPLIQASPTEYPLQDVLDSAFQQLFMPESAIQKWTTRALVRAVALRREATTVANAQPGAGVAAAGEIDQVVLDLVRDLLAPLGLLELVFFQPLKLATRAFYAGFLAASPRASSAAVAVATSPAQEPVVDYLLITSAYLRSDEALFEDLRLPSDEHAALIDIPLSTLLSDALLPNLVRRGLFALLDVFAPATDAAADGKGKAPEESPLQREAEHGLEVLASLARRVGKGSELRTPWGDWVRKQVERLISDPANDAKMVPALLSLRETISALLRGPLAFPAAAAGPDERDEDKLLRDAGSSAFQTGMGGRKNKPAEMIAKEIDALLRSKATSADSVDAKLDSLLTLVRYTRDKDVFRAFYVAALAKRLLLNRSSSEDAELKMVTRLKHELGEDFMKGDGMMADLKLSEGLMKGYRARVSPAQDMDLSVNVLSAANWPSYPALDKGWDAFALPPALQTALDGFKTFYLGAHQGRVLDWRFQLFQMTVRATFAGGKKELGLSLWQGLVLLGFEDVADGGRRSFAEIAQETGIEREELRRTLQSLACGKERVLVKHPKGRDVADDDAFAYNDDFTSDRFRVRVNQVQQAQTKEEDDKTESRVMHDRSHLLDAAIVRVMKSKKQMGWNELTNAVVDAVRNKFPPEPKAIKLQIESLIEREYLERGDEDEGGRKSLTYLA